MVCIDTNVVIAIIKGNAEVEKVVESYAAGSRLSITSITGYELLKHQDKLSRETALEFMSRVKVHGFDMPSAAKAAEIQRVLSTAGKMINENDVLIAGTALANNETLITRDRKFELIGSERILVVD